MYTIKMTYVTLDNVRLSETRKVSQFGMIAAEVQGMLESFVRTGHYVTGYTVRCPKLAKGQ